MAWTRIPHRTKKRWKEARKLRIITYKLYGLIHNQDSEGWSVRNPIINEDEYEAVIKVIKSLEDRAARLEVGC